MLNKTILRRRVARLSYTLSLSHPLFRKRTQSIVHLGISDFVVVVPKIHLCLYVYSYVCGCKRRSGQILGDLFYHVLKHSYVGCIFIALPSKMLRAFCYLQLFWSFFHRFSQQKVILKMAKQLLMKIHWLLVTTVSYFYSFSRLSDKELIELIIYLCISKLYSSCIDVILFENQNDKSYDIDI